MVKALDSQAASATAAAAAASPPSAVATPSNPGGAPAATPSYTEEQKQMVSAFAGQSGMNPEFSLK